MNHIKNILIVLIVILIIDIPVIGFFNNNMYKRQFKRINGNDSKIDKVQLLYAILCYILLSIGLYVFVIYPSVKNKYSNKKILLNGALLGLVIYGVYNFTNKATITKYGTYEPIVDTLWGVIAFTLFSYILVNLIK